MRPATWCRTRSCDLYRSLYEARPARAIDFFRLAALQIRRELHDLATHYDGTRVISTHHTPPAWKSPRDNESPDSITWDSQGADEVAANLVAWTAFHDQVEDLPEEEREVFDLLWYLGLPQAEAAQLLGVSERTVTAALGFGATAGSRDAGSKPAQLRRCSPRRHCRELVAVISRKAGCRRPTDANTPKKPVVTTAVRNGNAGAFPLPTALPSEREGVGSMFSGSVHAGFLTARRRMDQTPDFAVLPPRSAATWPSW